jgi:puromycin-sensitive aminopeptidase
MSTYLVAFVVGPLEITPGPQGTTVPLRVAHVPGRSHLTRYALDVAAFTVDFFADYYGIPYPGDKLDLVALPDFAFGAMENLGCVTFRESLLLVDPERVTQAERTNAALTIVHEIAHMWFGDLVTMKWWNGIWLNEAFATFMEHAGVDAYRPEWRTWDDFAVARAAALEIDALASTRPVEYDVRTPEDADGMFDVLTYQKGGAVVRMLERWLGADEFRAGVRAYLDRYRYGNTETTDLWDAIEEAAGQPVRRIMDAWIFRPGFPLMEVTRTPDGVSLRQRRCRADGDDDGSRWPVPVGLRWGGGGHDGAASVLLDGDALDLTIPSGARWVVANRGGHGFYRTQYDGTSARDLLAAGVLDAAERFTIVDDTWAAVVRGDTTATEFLSLAQSCGEEIDLVVWRALLAHLRDASRLLGGPALDAFREAVAGLVRPALDARRWVPAPGESERERELRALLIAALGDLARDDTTVAAARELLARELAVAGSVDADVLGACVKVVAASGTAADLDTFVDRFERAPTPQEQLRFLYALASFPGAPEFQRVLALAASDAVRTQNAPFVLQRALRHPEHGPVAWRFVRDHWDGLVARFPANLVPRMLEGITWLVDDRCAADVPPFLSDHVVPEGEQIIAQHLERQALHRRLWEREHDRFAAAVIEGAAAARD